MVEVNLKTDPLRPGWYLSEEVQSWAPGMHRLRNGMRPHIWRPPTDVYETEEAIIVRVEVAGMQEQDFTISLKERSLSIRGARLDISERRAYHQMEIFFGEFMSEVDLPNPVFVKEVTAEYRAGFLWVILPKQKPKKIQVSDS